MAELSGAPLGAKLKDLLIVATDKIPAMASIYGDSNGKLAKTSEGQNDAFYQHEASPAMGGGEISRIYGSWTILRDELQDVFGQTQTNLNDTATTMVEVVNSYARDDDAAEKGLRTAHEGNNDDAYHPEHNPKGDKNIPWIPPLGGEDKPGVPPKTEKPVPSEDNYDL
ncbi:MAG: hypothetical protein ACRD0P_04550 [Stackebrandtia sp.]